MLPEADLLGGGVKFGCVTVCSLFDVYAVATTSSVIQNFAKS